MTFAVIENVIIALQPYQLTIDDRQTEGQTDKPTPKLAFRRAITELCQRTERYT